MELKDFVAATLTQICEGIQKARENTRESGAIIAPRVDDTGLTAPITRQSGVPAQMIHFEVLLESQETADTGGGIKVAGGVISLGGNASSTDRATHAHKVSFDVPLVWPKI